MRKVKFSGDIVMVKVGSAREARVCMEAWQKLVGDGGFVVGIGGWFEFPNKDVIQFEFEPRPIISFGRKWITLEFAGHVERVRPVEWGRGFTVCFSCPVWPGDMDI